jgi:hypothetical protein
MPKIPTPHELRQSLRASYGSLAEPKWHFVQQRYESRPYAAIESELRQGFKVNDGTDLNDDVAVVLEVEGTRKSWVVWLSLIAPVAAVTRSGSRGVVSVAEGAGGDPEEEFLFGALERGGVTVLPQSLLELPIELALSNTEPQNVRYFQALFGDYDVLPWRAAAV